MIKSSNKYSSFWIVDDLDFNFTTLIQDKIDTSTKGLLKLAALRRSISKFVKIICGKMVPVEFLSKDKSFTDGKKVYISASVKAGEIDSTVGLAMHEASHIKETDFKILRELKNRIPEYMYVKAEAKNIKRQSTVKNIKNFLNWVEDRRIDHKTYMSSPGYKGYYIALYNRYFNSNVTSKALLSTSLRKETLESYRFRIFNLTNKNTDLYALKKLKEISDLIDIKNIDRLNSTLDSLELTFKIFDIILDTINRLKDKDDKKEGESEDGDGGGESEDEDDDFDDDDFDESDSDSDGEGSSKSDIVLTKKELNSLKNQIKKQDNFINGNVKKQFLSGGDFDSVNALLNSKTEIRRVTTKIDKAERIYESVYDGATYDVVVMREVTEQMCELESIPFLCSSCDPDTHQAIIDGISMGKKLGRRLLIRNDVKTVKYTRKNSGKIDRRLLSDLGFNNESVFQKTYKEAYSDAILHMSIDISGSMSGEKLDNSLKIVTAICKAADMLNKNLNVVVSVRGTSLYGEPLIAIVYDSRVDKFIKVKKLFPKITSCGTTPEGLCFAAIQHLIDESNSKLNSYFLNLSDGEPYYKNYSGELAVFHTKGEVHKMREKGIKILSYFIHSGSDYHHQDFKSMYGESAAFINIDSLNDIIKTLNKLFLEKN